MPERFEPADDPTDRAALAPWPGWRDGSAAVRRLAKGLPEGLGGLASIAWNYRWSWTPAPGGPALFRDLDPHAWDLAGANPVRFLREVPFGVLERAAADPEFVERVRAATRLLEEDLSRDAAGKRPVAFLCAEFGVHRSLPVYAGGLGVLAGDIMKEASDQGLPMVGVGLMYRQGYLHQQFDPSGWQREFWIETEPERLPATLVTGSDGRPLLVTVAVRGRDVALQIWRVDVGRVPLYLLDAERPENAPADRWITSRLYVGDRQVRLAQYVILGIGGVAALRALGVDPAVLHLNEGHPAFGPLELARQMVQRGETLDDALAAARSRVVFTTHTPVPAGNEPYGADEVLHVLDGFAPRLGLSEGELLSLGGGAGEPGEAGESFGMTSLGLRMSRAANGVSALHGTIARRMWRSLFPGHPEDAVPIGHVTNGVHLPTWMAPPMRELLGRYLGEGWERRAADPATWEAVEDIPAAELWSVRCALRRDLVSFVRERAAHDRLASGEPLAAVEAAARALDPDVLTVGFARRAAAYKRLYLLAHDRERALALLTGPRPVQVVAAGKSHPQDDEAKRILQGVFGLRGERRVALRVAYLHDYDMGIAERMVWGCDVWLNVPRYPLEASGTSGMKSALSGGLHLSVLDGWWAEAFDGTNGWGVPGEEGLPNDVQDDRDAAAVYDLLEREVVPMFHDRDESGVPRGWVQRTKASLRTIGPRFCATRMLDDYVRNLYPAP